MLEVSIFLFEIPTGVVADVYSRRLSIIIGLALIGVGFLAEGLIGTFAGVMLGQVLWGIGYTFTSGATEAWITDEVGESRVGPVFMRAAPGRHADGDRRRPDRHAAGQLDYQPAHCPGRCAVPAAGRVSGAGRHAGDRVHPRPARQSQQLGADGHHAAQRFEVVRGRPVLLAILGIGLFYGLHSEGFDRLNTAHLLESFTLPTLGGFQPVVWINLISLVVGGLLSAGALNLVKRRLDIAIRN